MTVSSAQLTTNKLDSTVSLLTTEAQNCGCTSWSSKYSKCINNTDYQEHLFFACISNKTNNFKIITVDLLEQS